MRKRRKKLKEVDADEYEDEIWLAYVEPQYENEFSRMIAAQKSKSAPSNFHKKIEAKLTNQRDKRKQYLKKLNPNVDIP